MSLSERQNLLDAIHDARKNLKRRAGAVASLEVCLTDQALKDIYDFLYAHNPACSDPITHLASTCGEAVVTYLERARNPRTHEEGYIQTLGDLAALTEEQVLRIRGIGPNTLDILRDALNKRGLRFAPSVEERQETIY